MLADVVQKVAKGTPSFRAASVPAMIWWSQTTTSGWKFSTTRKRPGSVVFDKGTKSSRHRTEGFRDLAAAWPARESAMATGFVVEREELGVRRKKMAHRLGVGCPRDAMAAGLELSSDRNGREHMSRERRDDEYEALHAGPPCSRPRQKATVRLLTSSVASQRTECVQAGRTFTVHLGIESKRGRLSLTISECSP